MSAFTIVHDLVRGRKRGREACCSKGKRVFPRAFSRSHLPSQNWALAGQPILGTKGEVSILKCMVAGEREILKGTGAPLRRKRGRQPIISTLVFWL